MSGPVSRKDPMGLPRSSSSTIVKLGGKKHDKKTVNIFETKSMSLVKEGLNGRGFVESGERALRGRSVRERREVLNRRSRISSGVSAKIGRENRMVSMTQHWKIILRIP
jgi:hypothetical protein